MCVCMCVCECMCVCMCVCVCRVCVCACVCVCMCAKNSGDSVINLYSVKCLYVFPHWWFVCGLPLSLEKYAYVILGGFVMSLYSVACCYSLVEYVQFSYCLKESLNIFNCVIRCWSQSCAISACSKKGG